MHNAHCILNCGGKMKIYNEAFLLRSFSADLSVSATSYRSGSMTLFLPQFTSDSTVFIPVSVDSVVWVDFHFVVPALDSLGEDLRWVLPAAVAALVNVLSNTEPVHVPWAVVTELTLVSPPLRDWKLAINIYSNYVLLHSWSTLTRLHSFWAIRVTRNVKI